MAKAFRLLLVVLCALSLPAPAQQGAIFSGLKKLYGPVVTPFGNGYIIRVNGVYAFSDKSGRLVLPFVYRQMQPLLADRMLVQPTNNPDYYLADADGRLLNIIGGKPAFVDTPKRTFIYYI